MPAPRATTRRAAAISIGGCSNGSPRVPGVESATLSTAVPLFAGGFSRTTFRDDQDIKDPRNGRLTQINEVGDRLFRNARDSDRCSGRAFNAERSPGLGAT